MESFLKILPLVIVAALAFVLIRAGKRPKKHDFGSGGDHARDAAQGMGRRSVADNFDSAGSGGGGTDSD